MGLFLFPLYLAGAAALGVPLWVHLRNRQSTPPYRFATLRFLVTSSIVSERRKQILRWLVLLLRLGALAALALAFAQPWLAAAVVPGTRAAVLVIDVSDSMRAGKAWAEASDTARQWLSTQPSGTRTAIISMGRSARTISTFADSLDQQHAALASLTPTYESTDPQQALALANRLLEQQPVSEKRLTLISDFTVAGWRAIQWDQPLSPGVKLDVIPVAAQTPANVAVTAIRTPRSFWNTTAPLDIVATARNFSSAPRTCQVTWHAGDQEYQKPPITIAAGAAQDIALTVTPTEIKTFRGSVRLNTGDDLPADDVRYFAVPARKPIRVAYWADQASDADVFLRAALEPSAAAADNRYSWTTVDPASTVPLAQSIDLLLLQQGTALDATRSAALEQFITGGGSVLVYLGDADGLTESEKKWLPITLGPKRSADALAGVMHPALLNFRHPILDPFSRPHGGDLFRVNVFRWRQFTCDAGSQVIGLANGDPLLTVFSQGKGRVAVMAMPMRRDWTDWPIQTTFLPLLHETLKWLQGDVAQNAGLLVGDTGPGGALAKEPGFMGTESALGGVVAVNLDPRESDLTRWTMLDRFKQLENPDHNPPKPAAAIMMTDDAGRRLTWLLLVGVGVFSVGELLLANRTPR